MVNPPILDLLLYPSIFPLFSLIIKEMEVYYKISGKYGHTHILKFHRQEKQLFQFSAFCLGFYTYMYVEVNVML